MSAQGSYSYAVAAECRQAQLQFNDRALLTPVLDTAIQQESKQTTSVTLP
jgi:hypothetical protein